MAPMGKSTVNEAPRARHWPAPRAALAMAIAAAGGLGLVSCGEGGEPSQAAASDRRVEPAPDPGVDSSAAALPDGERIYNQHCLVCHQTDGGGVPRLQPPLAGSDVTTGDIDPVIEMTLRGVRSGAGSLPGSDEWASSMPSFDYLSNEEIAAALTYVRTQWGNDASAVTPEQVQQARERIE